MDNNIKKEPNNNSSADTTKDNFPLQTSFVTVPKGRGAINSIVEKFPVYAANATAGFNIPFPFLLSLNGFMLSMSFNYNPGSGNGIFGFGRNTTIIHVASDLINREDRIADETFKKMFQNGIINITELITFYDELIGLTPK